MVDRHNSYTSEHILPSTTPLIVGRENRGSDELDLRHPQDHLRHPIFVQLLPVEVLESRTGAAVVLGNIGDIFWYAFVEQMRSEGRDIGSFQLKNISRGFFMAFYEHISKKEDSQAQGSVIRSMIANQTCLRTEFGDDEAAVRKIGKLLGTVKNRTQEKLKQCKQKKQKIGTVRDWLNEPLFPTKTAPEPPQEENRSNAPYCNPAETQGITERIEPEIPGVSGSAHLNSYVLSTPPAVCVRDGMCERKREKV
jgi:hypothetical protein